MYGNFRDLSTLADCDTDKSIDAASKLVCRLYDQKGKLKEDHVDLNKLRVRLATLRDACLAKLPPCGKAGQISKIFWTVFKYFKNGSFANPDKDDVESHLVMACAAGKMLHKTGLSMLQIECTGMKTPILGVCDRTRPIPD
jgi:hypothetical protein